VTPLEDNDHMEWAQTVHPWAYHRLLDTVGPVIVSQGCDRGRPPLEVCFTS
jgi:hypothetical protein